jgi:hypothetical protein
MGKWKYDCNVLNLDTRCKWWASLLIRFNPQGKSPRYPLDRTLGPRVELEAMEKRKISFSLLRIEPQPSSPYSIVIPTEQPQILLYSPSSSCVLGLLFDYEDGSSMFVNFYSAASRHVPNYNVWAVLTLSVRSSDLAAAETGSVTLLNCFRSRICCGNLEYHFLQRVYLSRHSN